MRLFWDLVIAPYFKGLIALFCALPYFALAFFAYDTSPWFVLSEGTDRQVRDILASLPTRRSSRNAGETDPVLLLTMFVVTYLVLLSLFRIQFIAAQLSGVVDGSKLKRLFVVSGSWFRMPGGILALILALIYVVFESTTNPHHPEYHYLAESVPLFSKEWIDHFLSMSLSVSAVVGSVFVLAGLSSIKNAGGMMTEIPTFLRRLPAIALLCVLHAILISLFIVVVASDATFNSMISPYLPVTRFWLLFAQVLLFFSVMSSVCAALWRRYLLAMLNAKGAVI